MIMLYDILKIFHLFAVFAWMAGLFYLPRLFVYHVDVSGKDISDLAKSDALLQKMERRLLKFIMNPAMLVSWIFGLWLMFEGGFVTSGWVHAKIMLVGFMTIFHMMLGRYRRLFAEGKNTHSEKFYRYLNEIPTLLLLAILILVVIKPF